MTRKIVSTLIFLAVSCAVFAQDTPPPPKIDSTSLDRPRKIPKGDLKPIEGTTMVPAVNIRGNILYSKNLSKFYAALEKAGLVETFRSKGPITIFVPDDDAMAKVPPGKLDTLLQPQRKFDLITLVTYHALSGELKTRDIKKQINEGKGKATLTTLTGSKLIATIEGGEILLTDENGGKCTIKRANLDQSNGLIHIVNGLLIPKFKII